MDLKCGQCGSEAVQRLSFLYQNGLSRIDTRSRGSAIGFGGGGLGVGTGRSSTQGFAQTGTSARAAPPKKRRYIVPMILIMFAVSLIPIPGPSFLVSQVHGIGFLLAECGWVYFAYTYNSREWPRLMDTWTNSYLCTRCDEVTVIR